MRETVYCCCLPVDTACRIVALIDILIGSLVFSFFGFMLRDMYDEKWMPKPFHNQLAYHHAYNFEQKVTDDRLLSWVILLCSGIQLVMGILLMRAIKMRNIQVCRTWQFVASGTCFLTVPFVLRIHHILVVADFVKAVEEESREAANRVCSVTQQTESFQQLHVPRQLEASNTHSYVSAFTGQNATQFPEYGNTRNVPAISYINKEFVYDQDNDPPPPYDLAVTMPQAKLQ